MKKINCRAQYIFPNKIEIPEQMHKRGENQFKSRVKPYVELVILLAMSAALVVDYAQTSVFALVIIIRLK